MWSYWRCDFSESRDLKSVIKNIQRNNPKALMAAIGYSAGGHLLMRYVSTYGDAVPLSCAITVSGCFDFVKAFESVSNNENPSYKYFSTFRSVVSYVVMLRTRVIEEVNAQIEQALRTESGIELYVHVSIAFLIIHRLRDNTNADTTKS